MVNKHFCKKGFELKQILTPFKVTFSSLSFKFQQMTDYAAYENISKATYKFEATFFTDYLLLAN